MTVKNTFVRMTLASLFCIVATQSVSLAKSHSNDSDGTWKKVSSSNNAVVSADSLVLESSRKSDDNGYDLHFAAYFANELGNQGYATESGSFSLFAKSSLVKYECGLNTEDVLLCSLTDKVTGQTANVVYSK